MTHSSQTAADPAGYKQELAAWPFFAPDEVEAAARVLRSGKVNYWTGQEGREFEREFATWCGTQYAVAVANGTVALELALVGLGLREGDEVVTTPRTFIATSSACVMRGLKPVFADVDRNSGNITAQSIERVLTGKTKAIIVVHLGGSPCDMDDILDLAEKHGLKVIEDCAQCHGAKYKGRSVGSMGHVGAWSFCQDKIMTTGGEGGMVTTNDQAVWAEMWAFKDHGKSFDAVYNRRHPTGFRWLHEDFGTNWRMTEVQSAIGRIQLQKLPGWVGARNRNASILRGRLSEFECIRVPMPKDGDQHSYYKFYCYVVPERLRSDWSRDRIRDECADLGVPCTGGTCSEIYLEKAFEKAGLQPEARLSTARELGETTLMFVVHPTISPEAMAYYAEVVASVLKKASVE